MTIYASNLTHDCIPITHFSASNQTMGIGSRKVTLISENGDFRAGDHSHFGSISLDIQGICCLTFLFSAITLLSSTIAASFFFAGKITLMTAFAIGGGPAVAILVVMIACGCIVAQ